MISQRVPRFHLRKSALALCISATLAGGLPPSILSAHPMAPHVVTSCLDDYSPGTLRYEVDHAISGETIDMSGLTCSTITLDASWPSPSIVLPQDSLELKGPSGQSLTIDGDYNGSVFRHLGTGNLVVSDLTITNGKYASDVSPRGACIYSAGDVKLLRSTISNCQLLGIGGVEARGGAIYTAGALEMNTTTVRHSAVSNYGTSNSYGGGVFVRGSLTLGNSTIDGNSSYSSQFGNVGLDGGISAYGDATIQGSTISGNRADFVGGADFLGGPAHSVDITNSTISSNIGARDFGGTGQNLP